MRSHQLERALASEVTDDAGLVDYALVFGPEQFVGDLREAKTILEIGCGQTALFASQLSKEIPDRERFIVSLSPHLVHADNFGMNTKNGVAGLAQDLPFRSDSFDLIVSSMAVPKFCEREELPHLLLEVHRVLATGGTAYLWPATLGRGHEVIEDLEFADAVVERLDQLCIDHLAHPQNANRIVVRK